MKKITLILTTILLIGLASSLYAGEKGILYSGINGELTNWIADGNTTSLEGINITQNGSDIYIELPSDSVTQNITFTLISGEEIVQVSSGGSSSRNKQEYIPWCFEWTECLNNYQERYCFTEELTTKETRVCGELPEEEIIILGEEYLKQNGNSIPEKDDDIASKTIIIIGGTIALGAIGAVVFKILW